MTDYPIRFHYLVMALVSLAISFEYALADDAKEYPGAKFSVPRGHFDQPFELTVTATRPGDSLFYTTDGSWPVKHSASGSASGEGGQARFSLTISSTTSVKVLIDRGSGHETEVITHSYIHTPSVLRQETPNMAFSQWGHSGPDWSVDPDIVNHRDEANRLTAQDLLSIPSLYISAPFEKIWGEDGIYIEGEGEPIECAIELLNPAGNASEPNRVPGLVQQGTVQITGGSSTHRWKTDKLSMRLKFHKEADFPAFEHARHLAAHVPPTKFHTLVLDARLNESWNHSSGTQREYGQYTRDQFIADLQNNMGGFAPQGRHVHLYLAGIYWGLYNLHERPDQHFASHYLGGSHKDYDVIKHQWDDVVHGSNQRFLELRDLVNQADVASPQSFEQISGLLDIEDFARYVLLNYWAGNTDWSHQNWYASFNRESPEGRWRFHSWDAEHTIKKARENVTTKDDADSPTHFHRQLMKNPQYRSVFGQLVQNAQKPGGILDPEFSIAAYQNRINEIDAAIRGESARWGDNRRRRPYTRGGEWAEERDRILQDYLPDRSKIVLTQFRDAGWID